jgi:hypothetical protein
VLDVAEHADRQRLARLLAEAAELEGQARVVAVGVVHQQVLGAVDDLEASRGVARDARVLSAPKRSGSPCSRFTSVSAADERSVNGSNAPSLNTGQFWRISTSAAPGCAAAARSTAGRCFLSRSIVRATNVGLGAERQRDGVQRLLARAVGRGLGDLAGLRRRGGLALGQPVDAVVEQQDLDRDVAAQRVHEVPDADRQRVAVAGDHPDREVGPRRGQAGGERGARPWMPCIP